MEALLAKPMASEDLLQYSALALAHIGDAVYEILARTAILTSGNTTGTHIHQESVRVVCAPSQAKAAELILPVLTEQESSFYRRGRNAEVHNIPKNATRGEYARATGLEALFGMLYLTGQTERIRELFAMIWEDYHAA